LLVATACFEPAGRTRWTLELLAGEMVKLTTHESVSRETVRRRLGETPQRRPRLHQMDVHNQKSPRQRPRLSQARRIRTNPKSQNLCDDLLAACRGQLPACVGYGIKSRTDGHESTDEV